MGLNIFVWCLASFLYFSAPETGLTEHEKMMMDISLAAVVLNRVRDDRWPNDVCGVTHQKIKGECAFAFACQDEVMVDAEKRHKKLLISTALLSSTWADPTFGSTHFSVSSLPPTPKGRYSKRLDLFGLRFYRLIPNKAV